MRVTFLGTAASEGYPHPFCGCQNCEQARILGGPSLRKRSATLINDDLVIDLGPDLIAATHQHGLSLAKVRFCLQTHAHADHLDTSQFLSRTEEYGVPNAQRLHWYASRATAQHAARLLERDLAPTSLLDPEVGARLKLEVHLIEAFQSFSVGPYQVTAFPANHDPSVEPLLYAITANQRTIFYGTDTAPLDEQTWQAFHQQKLRFDLVILDHTYNHDEGATDHLNGEQFQEHIQRMREENLLAHNARIIATHLAHASTPSPS